MSSHLSQKIARKHYYESRMRDVLAKKITPCQNCGEREQHFVPPSFGEPGFYICEGNKQ